MAKILICDDSKFTRQRVRDILKDIASDIIEAGDGVQGLEIIKNESPDLVLLDLLMPEMDGIGLLRELQAQHIDVPVIVLSADIQNTTVSLCIELGAKAFINKPPQKDTLVNTVKQYINAG
ncbi:MAG: response regulator [Ignavibacteria bacterium]|nr:response regulator [Ignavibacteria bacterium]